jgi:hypothetical protein
MAFVPEGQADSSQARSAWVAMQRGPRPGGTVEIIVSPTDIVVETEFMPLQKRQVLLLKVRVRFNRPAGTGLFSS